MTNFGWFHSIITEKSKKFAQEALSYDQLTHGVHTKRLEEELSQILNVPYCVYTNSGTSALSIALIAAGASSNSKVATSGIGWIATPQAIQLTGAVPHIIDVMRDKPLIDLNLINKKFDIIIPVNYNGRQVDLSDFVAKNPGVCIIEDCCKSLFSTDYTGTKYSGSNGRFGCFSLGMISLLPGVYGGVVTSPFVEDREKLLSIKWHGVSYDDSTESYNHRSFNFKSSNVHAAIALGMLEDFQSRLDRLRVIYSMYSEGLYGLENLRLLPVDLSMGEVPLLIDIISADRKLHINSLNNHDIPTCNYHKSLSYAPGVVSQYLPNSEFFSSSVFHPPCGPDQDLKVIDRTIKILRAFG